MSFCVHDSYFRPLLRRTIDPTVYSKFSPIVNAGHSIDLAFLSISQLRRPPNFVMKNADLSITGGISPGCANDLIARLLLMSVFYI